MIDSKKSISASGNRSPAALTIDTGGSIALIKVVRCVHAIKLTCSRSSGPAVSALELCDRLIFGYPIPLQRRKIVTFFAAFRRQRIRNDSHPVALAFSRV